MRDISTANFFHLAAATCNQNRRARTHGPAKVAFRERVFRPVFPLKQDYYLPKLNRLLTTISYESGVISARAGLLS